MSTNWQQPWLKPLGGAIAFTDGNKRVGFTAALRFLRLNGRPIPSLEQARATERTLALGAGAIGRAECARWLREGGLPG